MLNFPMVVQSLYYIFNKEEKGRKGEMWKANSD